MKILLDENIPVQLKRALPQHEVRSVNGPEVGWKGIHNGLLLEQMTGRFEVLITADRNMRTQQQLAGRPIAILAVITNRRREVLALAPRIAELLGTLKPGDYLELDTSGVTRS